MKRIKSILVVFFSLFILFPYFVNAATELSAATQNPVVGDVVYIQLEANYGDNLNIRDFHVYVTFDKNFFDVEDIIWIKNRDAKGTTEIQEGRVKIDKEGANWTSGPILQMKLRVKKAGFTNIEIERNGESYYTNGDEIAQTTAGIAINAENPSSETLIRRIWIEGYTLEPPFSNTNTNYNLTVPSNISFININATQGDDRQKITGTGTHQLEYGDNKIRVTSTAQDGSTRTYVLMVTREDDRTGDTTLKSLEISDTEIEFESGKDTYEAIVSRSVSSVMITGRTTDPKATLVGTGKKELAIGLNTFNLKVISSNGTNKLYTINITRSNEELNNDIKSSKLLKLKVNNLVLNFDENTKLFYFGIGKEAGSLSIEATPESKTAKIEIEGNDKLKDGLNPVIIRVIETLTPATEKTEAKLDITEYKILVYKNPKDTELITDFNNLNSNSNYLYTTTTSKLDKVPITSINNLGDKYLYYNVVNMSNGLMYQLKLTPGISTSDIDPTFNKTNEGTLTYTTNLPSGIEVLLNIENTYSDGLNLRVYSKDAEGNYNLVTDGVKVVNGYVKFETNGSQNYIFTQNELIKAKGPLEQFWDNYGMKIIGGFVIIVIVLLLINFLTKKLEEKEKNEPLY